MIENVPEGVTVSKLRYPNDSGTLSTIILLGVKQRTIIHASYVHDFLAEFSPEAVFVQMPPDLPVFTKTSTEQSDFWARWFAFLKRAKDVRFFVNSMPRFLSDIGMNNHQRLKKLMEENIKPCFDDYDLGMKAIYSRHKNSKIEKTLRPDALMTPLLYGYNTALSKNVQTYFGDMPLLTQRELIARTLTLTQAQDIFSETVEEWGDHANF